MRGGYELLKDAGDDASVPVRRSSRRAVFTAFIVGAILASALYACSPKVQHLFADDTYAVEAPSSDHLSSPKPLKQCAPSLPPPAKPPAPVNLWASLTVAETTSIHSWLNEPERGLNLTSAETATLSDNHIFLIEVYRPTKAEAVKYLESPRDNLLPTKYARVTVQLGGLKIEEGGPVIKDYLVGPLPVGKSTTMRELKEIYHRDDIPYNARGFAIPTELTPLLMTYMPRLAHVTRVRTLHHKAY